MLRNIKVNSRVEQLKAEHRQRHDLTVDDLIIELEEARQIAKDEKSAASMVSATMGKGKLLGLVVDKNEVSGRNGGPIAVENLSEFESARRVAYLLGCGLQRLQLNGEHPRGQEQSAGANPQALRKFDPESGVLEDA